MQAAMERGADLEFRVLVDDCSEMVADNMPIDYEELGMTAPFLDI